MDTLFLKVFNMSITASYVFTVVFLVRFMLKKGSRKFAYILWAVVFMRMVCPFTVKSVVSFIPKRNEAVVQRIENVRQELHVRDDIIVRSEPNNYVSTPPVISEKSGDPLNDLIKKLSAIWAFGVLGFSVYSILSYLKFKRKISTATIKEHGVYESDRIKTPFVLGMVKPKIYVPLGLHGQEYEYIINHEKVHIRRRDYLIKPVYFFAAAVHWFNPFMWLSYYLMTKDMEMSCDEKVMSLSKEGCKKEYAALLLDMAVKQGGLVSPIAFGENSTKSRIKNILKYKKQKLIVGVIAGLIVMVTAVGLITNPLSEKRETKKLSFGINEIIEELNGDQEVFVLHNNNSGLLMPGDEIAGYIKSVQGDIFEKLSEQSKVSKMTAAFYLEGNLVYMDFYEDSSLEVRYKNEVQKYVCPKDVYDKILMKYALVSSCIPQVHMDMILYPDSKVGESYHEYPHYGEDIYSFKVGRLHYYAYKMKDKYYIESPYIFTKEIPKKLHKKGKDYSNGQMIGEVQVEDVKNPGDEFGKAPEIVEDGLKKILDKGVYSNPLVYIQKGKNEIDEIIKYGGEDALNYMLNEFEKGNIDGLRGIIMMHLCKELLGDRNNVLEGNMTPQEWYEKLQLNRFVRIEDFKYNGEDETLKLVYDSIKKYRRPYEKGFMIPAVHVFDSYKEGDKLRVFTTVMIEYYEMYNKTVSLKGGSVVPISITYQLDKRGDYRLIEYKTAEDGAYFMKSIQEFCVMPESGRKIKGLSDKIMKHYSDHDDLNKLLMENLKGHLTRIGKKGISLVIEHYNNQAELVPLT